MYNEKITQELIYLLIDSSIPIEEKHKYLQDNNYQFTQFATELRILLRSAWATTALSLYGSNPRNVILAFSFDFMKYELVQHNGSFIFQQVDLDASGKPVGTALFRDFGSSASDYADLAVGAVQSNPTSKTNTGIAQLMQNVRSFAQICYKLEG